MDVSIEKEVFLTTERGMQKGPSGYVRLTDGYPKSHMIAYPRVDPKSLFMRLATRILNSRSGCMYSRFGSLKCEWAAREYCRRHPGSLVHLLWGDTDWAYLDLLLPKTVPIVATIHYPSKQLHEVLRFPKRLHRFDHWILMSPHQAPVLKEKAGLPDDRMTFIPHGIDTEAFNPRDSGPEQDSRKPFTLLHVGSYQRNFRLLEKLAESLSSDPGIELRVIGPPSLKEQYPGLKQARYESNLDSAAFLKAFRDSDCLLMTVEDATANNTILEGMACGLPIICEDNPSIREYTGAEPAVYSKPNDVQDMLACIKRLKDDPALRDSMAKASRQRAVSLSWENLQPAVDEVYRKAAARRLEVCGKL